MSNRGSEGTTVSRSGKQSAVESPALSATAYRLPLTAHRFGRFVLLMYLAPGESDERAGGPSTPGRA